MHVHIHTKGIQCQRLSLGSGIMSEFSLLKFSNINYSHNWKREHTFKYRLPEHWSFNFCVSNFFLVAATLWLIKI